MTIEREEKWLSRMVMATPITRQNFFEGEKKKKKKGRKNVRYHWNCKNLEFFEKFEKFIDQSIRYIYI